MVRRGVRARRAGCRFFFAWAWWRVEQALTLPVNSQMEFYIPSGTPLAGIAATVAAAGLPLTQAEFIAAGERAGVSKKLRPGHYRIAPGGDVRALLNTLARGEVITEKFVIIEGATFNDLRAKLLADSRFDNNNDLSADSVRAMLNITEQSPEGLFMPETYFFNKPAKAEDILRRAHQRSQKILNDAWAQRIETEQLKTPYDALILASIVEKETGGKRDEQGLIASVFLNRLKKGMRLQADPTVIYGLGEEFDGNLTREHLRRDTPYNTYTRHGLPPTPIALPGAAAVSAVLSAPETNFYYFVADGSGGHKFSKTLREHNNAVNKYQRRRKK